MLKNRKFIIGISSGVLVVVLCLVFLVSNKKPTLNEEIVPTAEINEEQALKAKIVLYYINKESGKMETEERLIETKLLKEEPAKEMVKELLKGPINEKLKCPIPEGTKVLSVKVDKEIATIDFSKEFTENSCEDQKQCQLMIDTIVKTVTELTEVNGIKILVDGTENCVMNSKLELQKVFLKSE